MRDFRTWFKNLKPYRENNQFIDEHFLGVFDENTKKTGFFGIYHGEKENIANFLMDGLKNAQDGQAIYEFIQNAADCNSTYFAIFYNENYFLALNNGLPFSQKDINSILNANQSSKTDNTGQAVDCGKIGRFGIGFKLVHRLVGENDGMTELTKDYKGPIVFSWSAKNHIEDLQKFQPENSLEYSENAPYLFKILITNFPAMPNESVKNIDYQDQILFENKELNEFVNYFQSIQNQLDFQLLNQGSMFFLKLGKNKKNLLDEQYQSLISGVRGGLNNLKTLQTVNIQNTKIDKLPLNLIEFNIDNKEIIKPEDEFCPIKMSFGYLSDYKKGIDELRASPNFYKYFPMGKENHGLNFTFHSTAFRIKTDRTQLEEDTNSTNTSIFQVFWKYFEPKLQEIRQTNPQEFKNIYANLLVSKPLLDENGNKKWFYDSFYLPLLNILKNNIPTKNNQFSDNAQNVKIKNFNIDIDLNEIGLGYIQWFEWDNHKEDKELLIQVREKEKIGLKIWDFSDLILNCNIVKMNDFLLKTYNNNIDLYSKIITELNELTEYQLTANNYQLFNQFAQLNFFHYFQDDSKYASSFSHCIQKNIIILESNYSNFSDILSKLGFLVSTQNIDANLSAIGKILTEKTPYIKDKLKFYEMIESKIKIYSNKLTNEEKKYLFETLKNIRGVGIETLKNITLFVTQNQEQKPLKYLLNPNLILPNWLNNYKIDENEYFSELDEYLLQENEIYSEIILKDWENLKDNFDTKQIKNEYKQIIKYFDLSENKTPFQSTQNFIFIDEEKGFLNTKNVFFNELFSQIKNYKYFQNGIFTLTGAYTPEKESIQFLAKAPFNLNNENFEILGIENESQLFPEEIKEIIDFCISNREGFFKYGIIEKNESNFIVFEKNDVLFQIISAEKAKKFIETNLFNSFKILPSELSSYKESNFILKGENFWNELLKQIDIDEHAEELIDIIAYNEPKHTFLLELSEIILEYQKQYSKDDFEYKILEMSCNENILNENDYPNFREKIIIKTEEKELFLADIPPFVDKINIDSCKVSLSKILPNSYQNTKYLSDLFTIFKDFKDKLQLIFGIKEQENYQIYYDLLLDEIPKTSNSNTPIIQNTEQLIFLLHYHTEFENINLENFYVDTFDTEYLWHLNTDFYLNNFSFIAPENILSDKIFKKLNKYVSFLENFEHAKISFLTTPYFQNDEFYCPKIKKSLTEKEQIDFFNFLFEQWKIKENTAQIKNIDWSKIDDFETENVLDFNPNLSVYPNEYALEEEYFPEYVQNWLLPHPALPEREENKSTEKLDFLADLGVQIENSLLVKLRKYFKKESEFSTFDIAKIENITLIFNTLAFMKINELKAENEQDFEMIENLVKFFNEKSTEICIEKQVEFDFDILVENNQELNTKIYQNWLIEIDNKFKIYLFDGEMPQIVKYDEFEDYIFYRFNEGNVLIDRDNWIYINKNIDLKKALRELAEDKTNDFSDKHLSLFYEAEQSESPNEIDLKNLLSENQLLKQQMEKMLQENKFLREKIDAEAKIASSNPTTTKDEYFNEIKEKSESILFEYLKKEFSNYTIKWLNFDENIQIFIESYAQHDFEILDKNGNTLCYIDAKGTPANKTTFYLSEKEWHFFLENKENYYIYRIFGVENTPSIKKYNLWESIQKGEVVPYLNNTEEIKSQRVFLTILNP